MGAVGFEQSQFPAGNTGVTGRRGNKSGNSDVPSVDPTPQTTPPTPSDPELASIIAAWGDLPPAIRAGVVALVKAGTPTPAQNSFTGHTHDNGSKHTRNPHAR